MWMIWSSFATIHCLIDQLSNKFQIKKLGRVSDFLGIQILAQYSGYLIHQEQYTNDLLAKAGVSQAHRVLNSLPSKVITFAEKSKLLCKCSTMPCAN